MGRLVMVSNRVGSSLRPNAGGLATAIAAALAEREAIWFGWSGTVTDQAGRRGVGLAYLDRVAARGRVPAQVDTSVLIFDPRTSKLLAEQTSVTDPRTGKWLSGDAVELYKRIEGLSYKDALRQLGTLYPRPLQAEGIKPHVDKPTVTGRVEL